MSRMASRQKLLEKYVNYFLDDDDQDEDGKDDVNDEDGKRDKNSEQIVSETVSAEKAEAKKAFRKYQDLSRKHVLIKPKTKDDKENKPKAAGEGVEVVAVRPPRAECSKCAKFFLTASELENHLKVAKLFKWACSSSGGVRIKRSLPTDDNEVARTRKRLRPLVEDNSPLVMPKHKMDTRALDDSGIEIG
eukprot:GFUD01036133.1.p1 GENE.GFUD01036133.1~~GFUD01036133.1.p1  ORF type:complete len:190 (+),score=55.33 GFUD01036133.1:140-709(+)